MIMVLLVPVLRLALKVIPVIFIMLIAVMWFFPWPLSVPRADAVLFFTIGAYWAITKREIFCLDSYSKPLFCIYVIVQIADVCIIGDVRSWYLHNCCTLLGVPVALCLTKLVLNFSKLKKLLLQLSTSSFFVFAIHEPLLTVCQKATYSIFKPEVDSLVLLLYFLIPVVVILLSIITYNILRAVFPNFLTLIAGGR